MNNLYNGACVEKIKAILEQQNKKTEDEDNKDKDIFEVDGVKYLQSDKKLVESLIEIIKILSDNIDISADELLSFDAENNNKLNVSKNKIDKLLELVNNDEIKKQALGFPDTFFMYGIIPPGVGNIQRPRPKANNEEIEIYEEYLSKYYNDKGILTIIDKKTGKREPYPHEYFKWEKNGPVRVAPTSSESEYQNYTNYINSKSKQEKKAYKKAINRKVRREAKMVNKRIRVQKRTAFIEKYKKIITKDMTVMFGIFNKETSFEDFAKLLVKYIGIAVLVVAGIFTIPSLVQALGPAILDTFGFAITMLLSGILPGTSSVLTMADLFMFSGMALLPSSPALIALYLKHKDKKQEQKKADEKFKEEQITQLDGSIKNTTENIKNIKNEIEGLDDSQKSEKKAELERIKKLLEYYQEKKENISNNIEELTSIGRVR